MLKVIDFSLSTIAKLLFEDSRPSFTPSFQVSPREVEDSIFSQKGVSLRLDLTDICMGCAHCYANGRPNGTAISEAQLEAMIDAISDLTGNYGNSRREVKHRIMLGRTDMMYPGQEDLLFARAKRLLEALKKKRTNNLEFEVYSSGKLFDVDAAKWKEMVIRYYDLFTDFFGDAGLAANRVAPLITSDRTFHQPLLSINAVSGAYAIWAEETRKRLGVGTGLTAPEFNSDNREKKEESGIAVDTESARRADERKKAPPSYRCMATFLTYPSLIPKDSESFSTPRTPGTLTLTRDGYANFCCGGLAPIAMWGKGVTERIKNNLRNNIYVRTLIQTGPLGVAELIGPQELETAIKTYQRFGPCAVCYDLNRVMKNNLN